MKVKRQIIHLPSAVGRNLKSLAETTSRRKIRVPAIYASICALREAKAASLKLKMQEWRFRALPLAFYLGKLRGTATTIDNRNFAPYLYLKWGGRPI
jgi:hypothetical protein